MQIAGEKARFEQVDNDHPGVRKMEADMGHRMGSNPWIATQLQAAVRREPQRERGIGAGHAEGESDGGGDKADVKVQWRSDITER